MCDRKRVPIMIHLTTEDCVSLFIDFRDPHVAKMVSSEADRKTAKELDALNFIFSREIFKTCRAKKITRELGFACSLLVNSINSFPTITKAIAIGDLSGGLAAARSSIEGLVRASAIICSSDAERKKSLYIYENSARDNLARRRTWLGQLKDTDNLPRVIGKLSSNPMEESGDPIQLNLTGHFERMKALPSKNFDDRAKGELLFQKCLNKIDCIESDEESVKVWIKDWHSLSSSFSHADAFSVHIANTVKVLATKHNNQFSEVFLDLMKLLTTLFCDAMIRLAEEVSEAEQATYLTNTKKKFLKSQL